jgi:hypothetical protein
MQFVPVIVGYRVPCRYCGKMLRKVMVPAISDRWVYCEDFQGKPEWLEFHSCQRDPGHVSGEQSQGPPLP